MADDSGMWVKVYPEYAGGGGAEGSPTAPMTIDINGNVVSSSPAGEGDAGQPIAYGAKVTSELEGDAFTWTLYQPIDPIADGPEVELLDTTPNVNYEVQIFGLNAAGSGSSISTGKFQINYNRAISDNTIEVNDSNGNKWRVHELKGPSEEIEVIVSAQPFSVAVVAGGQYTGNNNPNTVSGRTGGKGGAVVTQEMNLLRQKYSPVAIGKGQDGTPAGDTTFEGLTASGFGAAGGQGGTIDVIRNCPSGGPGTKGAGCNGEDGTNFPPNTPQFYGGGGGGGGGQAFSGNSSGAPGGTGGAGGGANGGKHPGNANWSYSPQPVANTGGGGGGASGVYGGTAVGSNGAAGCVAIAYKIGTMTKREMQKEKDAQVSYMEGVEYGIDKGKEDGYYQGQQEVQSDLYAAAQEVKATVGDIADDIIDEVIAKVSDAAANNIS